MSVVVVKADRISIFHGNNGKHAGTLELNEIINPGHAAQYKWFWNGGPLGPQSGSFSWDDDSGSLLLSSPYFLPSYGRFLTNDAWRKADSKRPLGERPYFKWRDKIELIDPNFLSRPSYPHVFKCKLISAAGS
ncbi:MAG: hypothetical protein V9H25_08145 [Candidatus Competibacter sp.]|jgi:hypothetical protein|nr:hypothetical protein [Nitrospira sp.]